MLYAKAGDVFFEEARRYFTVSDGDLSQMAIPDYQSIMLPLLKIAADGQKHHIGTVIKTLAKHFSLSESEQKEMLPSGVSTTFGSRVGWHARILKKRTW